MLALLVTALGGCTSLSHSVNASAYLPPDAPRIEVQSHQRLLLPGEFGPRTMPDYPDAVPPRRGALAVACLSFLVDEGGEVQDIRPQDFPGADCGTEAPEGIEPFLHSAREAVAQWSFIAAAICEYPTADAAKAANDQCSDAVSLTPVAVRLAWTFRFRVDAAGRTSVSATR